MSVPGKLLQVSGSAYGRKFLESVSASAPYTGKQEEGSRVPYTGETTFDSNLVIILAALLCALICALGLNSMVRCALRCSRRMVFESADDVAIRLANTGLKRKAMKALPTIVYSSGSRFPESGADCPICLAEFVEGENVRVLPKCNHSFHVDCIDTWLLAHSSCPTCRHCLLDTAREAKSGAAPPCETAALSIHVDAEPSPVAGDTSSPPPLDSITVADVEAGGNRRPS